MTISNSPSLDRAAALKIIRAGQDDARASRVKTADGKTLKKSKPSALTKFFNGIIDAMHPAQKRRKLKVQKNAKQAEPSHKAENAPLAPFVKTPKKNAPAYQASELKASAYAKFQKKNAAARQDIQILHLAAFPKNMIEEYEADYNKAFPLEYAASRRRGNTVNDALVTAREKAEEEAFLKFLDSEDPQRSRLGLIMSQCKVNIVFKTKSAFKKKSVSIAYERIVKTPAKPPRKLAKPVIAPKPVIVLKPLKRTKPPIAPKPLTQKVSFTPSPKLDAVADQLSKFVLNPQPHAHQENVPSVKPRRTARPIAVVPNSAE